MTNKHYRQDDRRKNRGEVFWSSSSLAWLRRSNDLRIEIVATQESYWSRDGRMTNRKEDLSDDVRS